MKAAPDLLHALVQTASMMLSDRESLRVNTTQLWLYPLIETDPL